MGLNRFVIHTSVHQPLVDKGPGPRASARSASGSRATRPGPSRRRPGSATSRAARSCCSRAASSPTSRTSTARTRTSRRSSSKKAPPIPAGYNFDYVNADALVHLLSVSGRPARGAERHAVPRAGARSEQPAHVAAGASQIRELVAAGAVVVGPKPTGIAKPERRRRRSSAAWPTSSGAPALVQASIVTGKGTVYGDGRLEATCSPSAACRRTSSYTKPKADTTALFVHRVLADGDLYFVNNRQRPRRRPWTRRSG